MTDYAAEDTRQRAGATATKRTGTASSDTVPTGSRVLWVNAGAGTHVVTLTTNNTVGGLAVADQPVSIPATSAKASFIDPDWGDANGRVAVAIDGTPTEVTYYVLAV